MHRPEGWENPFNFMNGGAIPKYEKQSQSYEDGADAMLELLKDEGLHGEYLEDYIISVSVKPDDKDWAEDFLTKIEQRGYLVFIPEEE